MKKLFLSLACCRAITARQDAVEELCNGTCPGLLKLRDMLARCPDLEKGLCSIYHGKVCLCVCVRLCMHGVCKLHVQGHTWV